MELLGPEGFDATSEKPLKPYDPLPVGKYIARIAAVDERLTRAGDGRYLELRFEVVEGEHRGRCLWVRLNLKNPSKKAMQLAHAWLGEICRAVGIDVLKNPHDLEGRELRITVRQRRRRDTGEIESVIRQYAEAPPRRDDVPQDASGDAPGDGRDAGHDIADPKERFLWDG